MGGKKRLTNDEAIYVLKNTAFLGWSEQAEKVSEAVWMAIDALNQLNNSKDQLNNSNNQLNNSKEDAISRQTAINAFYTATADGDKAEWCECVLRNVPPFDKDINVSCKDAISRQVAIDALEIIPVREFKKTDGLLDALISIGQVYRALKQLPPVQPEPQWIPCSERLPEVGAFVLVSKKAFPPNVCMAHRSRDPRSGKEAWNDMLFGKLDDDRVLAWMPLPEPFREEGENE